LTDKYAGGGGALMIKRFTLGNGIRVVCEHMEQIRSVVIGVWVGAGARHERSEHFGVSHFIEHLLFKGTERRTARQIAEEIDYIGGHINAFTAKDCTCYYTKTLDAHIHTGIDILSDIIRNSKLSEADVGLERNVILEEINMYEDSPDELVHELLAEEVWKSCALGNPILGRPETIARIDGDVMRRYMSGAYVPDRIVISVAGKFDEARLLEMLEGAFGGIACDGVACDGAGTNVSTGAVSYNTGTCLRVKDTEQIHLCIGFDGIELGNDDNYALHLVNFIFGGGMSSVLFQKIREELGLVYSIYSYISAYRGAGLYTIYAGMHLEQAGHVYGMIFDELEAFKKSGMTAELLDRAKEQFKGSFLMGLESVNARMSSLGKSELLLGYIHTPEEIVNKIEGVTLDGAYGVMSRVFDFNKLSLSAVGRIDGRLEEAFQYRGN